MPAAPIPEDAGGGPEGQLDRDQRRHVVQRELGVEDRQERDRHQRRGQQRDAALEEALRDQVEEPDREHAEHCGEHARDDPDLGRIDGEGVGQRGPAAEVDLVDDRQQVGVGRRVIEIVGIAVVGEQRDRMRHEVLVLVGVVDVGQAALDPPQTERQGEHEDRAEGARPACARRHTAQRVHAGQRA